MSSVFEKVASLGALANATLEVEKLLGLVVEATGKLVGAEAGSIMLLEGDHLVFVVATGSKKDEITKLRLPKGRSVAWWVVENKKAYICNDPEGDPLFSGDVDRALGFTTRNLLAVPVMLGGSVFGVLEAVNKRRGVFLRRDLSVLEAFAHLVAVAIRNAKLFDKLRRAHTATVLEMELEYDLVGASEPMERIRELIRRVAPTPSTVLITGESGVGKEVVARQIHLQSERSQGPFVKVSCPAFPETLLESELFGHEKGAFTGASQRRIGRFEAACGGTIFLDEVGDLPPTVQAKLLRVLQEGVVERLGSNEPIRVDVRVIAATNKDLQKAVEQGTFRRDLFYRLNVVPIHIPPLRERKEDIPLLVEHFIEKFRRRFPHNVEGISEDALELLLSYDWPGNVRELENAIERAIVVWSPRTIKPEHLPAEIRGDVPLPQKPQTLPDMERCAIIEALRKAGGNQVRAARLLGISRDKLRYRMKKYNINPRNFKQCRQ